MSDLLPTISIVFPTNARVETAIFVASNDLRRDAARLRYHDVVVGTVILYDTMKNSQWFGHRVDFLLKKEEEGWRPYVSEYDIETKPPMKYDIVYIESMSSFEKK
jgi:hypothetical protein